MVSATEPRAISETAPRGGAVGGAWGAALLVAGSRLSGGQAEAVALAFTSLGELFHAGRDPWLLRRLSPAAGEWLAPSRAGIKHHLADLARRCDAAGAMVVVVAGLVVAGRDGPALVTGAHHDIDPAGATLPLSALREVIVAECAAAAVVVVVGWADGTGANGSAATAWADVLHTGRAADLIVVGDQRSGADVLDALGFGLAGEAIDPTSGTVTSSSLADHLRRAVPTAAIRAAGARRTIARPPASALVADLLAPRRRGKGSDDDDLTGVTLPGELRLDGFVAKGGFGAVYRAWNLALARPVAVKILRRGHDPDSEEGRLFRQEIRSIAQIKHRNVVYVHHADVTLDGRLFFEMELLEGVTLQQLAEREGPLPRPRAIDLTCQLLAGLSAAHGAGLIHADVKPSNVVVVDDGGRDRAVLIDFGLARLRQPDGPAESAGGTRSYMAPEQLHHWRVDARSDIYAAALVMVRILTGWQRPPDGPSEPPIDAIDDPALRAALGRALAEQPADRYATAEEFAAALGGGALPSAAPPLPPPPFRHLASFTERDRGRLHGRDRDIVKLAKALESARTVVLTAPSGTGKTSVLRAGLIPYFEARGTRAVYWPCDDDSPIELARVIAPGVDDLAEAVNRWHEESLGRRLVVVLDQVERVLGPGSAASPDGEDRPASALLAALLAFERYDPDASVKVLLSVREDFHARLFAAMPRGARSAEPVTLPPLDRAQASAAIVRPLNEHRLTIAPDLLEELLDDLVAAGAQVGAEMGWGSKPAVYPPHLQLACSVLYGKLGPRDAELKSSHYHELGGFVAIVGEHLQRVLDALSPADRDIARELFLVLITSARTKVVRAETELFELLVRFPSAQVASVLETLRERGLLVPLRGRGGERMWELVHESLVKTIEGWVASQDLDRRRVADVMRYHLRQSESAPSLLGPGQLRDLARHPGLVDDLDKEWSRRPASTWTPSQLVERSRRAVAYRRGLLGGVAAAVLVIIALLTYTWWAERERSRAQAILRDRDLGLITLELRPFDWDPDKLVATDVDAASLPDLDWTLHEPAAEDPTAPGEVIARERLVRGARRIHDKALIQDAEVRGGDAVLVITGRARAGAPPCGASILPIRRLPGHAERGTPKPLLIPVPTCQATLVDTIEIPAGRFISGGAGDLPSALAPADVPPENVIDVSRYRIDRTEITNAAFVPFAGLGAITGLRFVAYPEPLAMARGPGHPRAEIDAMDAMAFCRFLGKRLPTSVEWQKAMRGGLQLPDGSVNPLPRRNLPWGAAIDPVPANLRDTGVVGPDAVESTPGDVSPYGVLGLAGNVQEWTSTPAPDDADDASLTIPPRITRGGNWSMTTTADLLDYMVGENTRSPRKVDFYLGARCAAST